MRDRSADEKRLNKTNGGQTNGSQAADNGPAPATTDAAGRNGPARKKRSRSIGRALRYLFRSAGTAADRNRPDKKHAANGSSLHDNANGKESFNVANGPAGHSASSPRLMSPLYNYPFSVLSTDQSAPSGLLGAPCSSSSYSSVARWKYPISPADSGYGSSFTPQSSGLAIYSSGYQAGEPVTTTTISNGSQSALKRTRRDRFFHAHPSSAAGPSRPVPSSQHNGGRLFADLEMAGPSPVVATTMASQMSSSRPVDNGHLDSAAAVSGRKYVPRYLKLSFLNSGYYDTDYGFWKTPQDYLETMQKQRQLLHNRAAAAQHIRPTKLVKTSTGEIRKSLCVSESDLVQPVVLSPVDAGQQLAPTTSSSGQHHVTTMAGVRPSDSQVKAVRPKYGYTSKKRSVSFQSAAELSSPEDSSPRLVRPKSYPIGANEVGVQVNSIDLSRPLPKTDTNSSQTDETPSTPFCCIHASNADTSAVKRNSRSEPTLTIDDFVSVVAEKVADKVQDSLLESLCRLSPTMLPPVDDPNRPGHKFLETVDNEATQIEQLCQKAESQLQLSLSNQERTDAASVPADDSTKTGHFSDELRGRIRAVVGKAQLLLTKKFEQFRKLCRKNIQERPDEQFCVTEEDLAGFWEMVMIQVDLLKAEFTAIFDEIENGPPPTPVFTLRKEDESSVTKSQQSLNSRSTATGSRRSSVTGSGVRSPAAGSQLAALRRGSQQPVRPPSMRPKTNVTSSVRKAIAEKKKQAYDAKRAGLLGSESHQAEKPSSPKPLSPSPALSPSPSVSSSSATGSAAPAKKTGTSPLKTASSSAPNKAPPQQKR